MRQRWWVSLLLVVALFFGGCTANTESGAVSESADSTAATESTDSMSDPESMSEPEPEEDSSAENSGIDLSNYPQLQGNATVEIVVNGSSIIVELDGNAAPVTAGNFVDLVQREVYDGTVFHRVIREPDPFVAQGGDPQSKDPSISPDLFGTGNFVDPATGRPRYIPLEIQPAGAEQPIYSQTFDMARTNAPPELPHTRGAIAMARSNFPDSASAQFYFALSDLDFLNGNYAVFGYVTEGMEIVDEIQPGDRIESARVITGAENLRLPE